MRADIQSLKLNQVPRSEVYDRQVMDEKLKNLVEEITSAKAALDKFQADLWKLLGGLALAISTVIMLYQHLTIH